MKRGLAGSMSNSSFLTSSSGSICSSKSPSRLSVAQEEDSLSVLLRERAAARREKEQKRHGDTTARLPMGTLEEAWIEFAALTASVRVATERLVQWSQAAKVTEESPKVSAQRLQSLERVARTRALHGGVVDPDEAAHKLAKRMLDHIQPRRALPTREGEQ
ncbi:hypothetical protein GQ600_7585 [Phytophthora cactorum]|nr:hypothetical protein GQ600_7585 [Phytophthora cactorum]